MTGLINSAVASAASALNSSWGNPGVNQFKLSYQVSPIILTNGIATGMPGGGLPIISITEAQHFPSTASAFTSANPLAGLTNMAGKVINNLIGDVLGGGAADLDDYFAHYQPLPGSSIIDQDIGEYPFANQSVAANAVIVKPLRISLLMICPMRDPGAAAQKLSIMTSLQAALSKHNTSGGTYTIATPSFLFTDCVMRGMRDASQSRSKQVQVEWQLDFEKPLLTLEQAQQQQSALMSKISNGVQAAGDPPPWSGGAPNVGFPPGLALPSVVPAAAGAIAGVVGGLSTLANVGIGTGLSVGVGPVTASVGVSASLAGGIRAGGGIGISLP